jgi:hypothetical protein
MCFYPLTGLASIDILLDIVLHSRPPIIASDKLCSLVATRMSGKGRIVILTNNVLSECGVNRNVNMFAKGDQSTFQLFPAFFSVLQRSLHSLFSILRMLTDQGLELDRFRLKIEAADELGFEQNFIFIIALPRVKVMASQQCVGFDVLSAGHITESEMIVCEF